MRTLNPACEKFWILTGNKDPNSSGFFRKKKKNEEKYSHLVSWKYYSKKFYQGVLISFEKLCISKYFVQKVNQGLLPHVLFTSKHIDLIAIFFVHVCGFFAGGWGGCLLL